MTRFWKRFRLVVWWGALLPAALLSVAQPVEAQAGSQFSSAILSGWSANLSSAGGYEDGAQFALGQPVRAFSVGANGSVAKLWRTRSNRLEVSGGGGLRSYPSNPTLDQRTYDVSGSITHSFSRTTTASFGMNASSFFVDRAITASGPGVALGRLVNLQSTSAAAAFGLQLRRGYTASFSANRSEMRTNSVGIFGGTFASVGASMIGQLSRSTSLSFSTVSQYSRFDTVGVTLPRASATLSYNDPFGFTAGVTAGTVFGSAGGIPLASRIGVGVSVGFRNRFLGQISGDLNRDVGQAFGIVTGIQVTQSAAFGISKPFTRAWSGSTRLSIGTLSTVEAGAPSTSVALGTISTSLALSRTANLSVGVYSNSFGASAGQRFNGKGVTASLSYGWSQSRPGAAPAR
jgi:hypothetical protein